MLIKTITPSMDDIFASTCPSVQELMGPNMETRHRVEADRAMLSCMMPVAQGFNDHADEITNKYPSLSTGESNSTDDDCGLIDLMVESNISLKYVCCKRLIDFLHEGQQYCSINA
jgi:hypothetical protein